MLAFVFDTRSFGWHDPFTHRAYLFGGSVASLAALSIGMGIRGSDVHVNKAGAAARMLIGTLALVTSAMFLFGTILVGD